MMNQTVYTKQHSFLQLIEEFKALCLCIKELDKDRC